MPTWFPEKRNDITNKVFLFVISPFFAFLYSIKRIKTKSSYLFFFLFALFFGLSFTVELNSETYIDSASYRGEFEMYNNISKEEFTDNFKRFLSFDDGKKDYYFDTIAYYVSKVTDNYHIMFMVFAAIFAFVSLKSFKFLTSEDNFDFSLSSLILSYLFMFNHIFNINGMRFWTAAWIGVYCIFQIFRNNNKKYFLLALLTPFFHGTFWIYIGLIIAGYFLKKFEKIWVILFVISLFVSNISVDLIQNMSDFLPSFLSSVIQSYTFEDYINKRNQEGTGFWIVAEIFRYLVRIYMNIIILLFIKNSAKIKNNYKTKNLYTFLLVYMTFVNFVMPVPSLGVRFIILSYPIIAYIWLVNFKGVIYTKYLYILPFVFFMTIYDQLKLYNLVIPSSFYISNPIYLLFKYLAQ